MMTKLAGLALCMSVLLMMTACGDDGGSKPDTIAQNETGPTPDTINPDGSSATTFAAVYTQVIQPNCSCHLGSTHSTGLIMPDADTAYGNLVGVATGGSACTGRTRVTAGDSAASVLFHKVNGDGDLCGSRMPLGGAKLSQSLIDMVKAWIDSGAPK